MSASKNWYAIYTKPRWEKKVDEVLKLKGVESYCPLRKIRKKWSDRYKIVNEPLFKSYLFVNAEKSELSNIREVNGVVNFVYWNGKPAIVKEREIDDIRRFMNEYDFVELFPLDVKINDRIKIEKGVMMDREGDVLKVNKKTVEVVVESLGYKIVALVSKSSISLLAKETTRKK